MYSILSSYSHSPRAQTSRRTSGGSPQVAFQGNTPFTLEDVFELENFMNDHGIQTPPEERLSQGAFQIPDSPSRQERRNEQPRQSNKAVQTDPLPQEVVIHPPRLPTPPAAQLAISDATLDWVMHRPGLPFLFPDPYASINTPTFRQVEAETALWEDKNPFNLGTSNYLQKGLVGTPVRHALKPHAGETLLIGSRWKLKTVPNRRGAHKNEYQISSPKTKKSAYLTAEEYNILNRCLNDEHVAFAVNPFKKHIRPDGIKVADSLLKKLGTLKAGRLVLKTEEQYHISYFIPSS